MKPLRILPQTSARTRQIHTQTSDSGERREIFGYMARRTVTIIRTSLDSRLQSESECDGWYINAPAAWLNLHQPAKGARSFITSAANLYDTYEFTETGAPELGFLLQARRIWRSFLPDTEGNVTVHEHSHDEEVTEISEEPLAPAFFVPPREFRQVLHLPDQSRMTLKDRIRLQWEMLKDSHALPAMIARFTA